MARVFLIVLDSLGVGALPDAQDFGDAGAHTLDHIASATGGLDLPCLAALGLGRIEGVTSIDSDPEAGAAFGRLAERSPGKDTSTGHWEMMGCLLTEPFPVFPNGFPSEILDPFLERSGLDGVLANEAASGTEIIERLGAEHIETGWPIVYTSADSVFQVAAHEEHFGLERLLEICRIAREILTPYGVGRVIARPFVGEVGSFQRTYNRRDFSLLPPKETSLDRLQAAGVPVIGVGKIKDIFAGRGLTASHHTEGNRDGMAKILQLAEEVYEGLIFVNLIDFDMLYGHRRDPVGYRAALEEFDAELPKLTERLRPGDLLILTADHGNDPTHKGGTDHTREYIPVIALGPGLVTNVDLGTRETFADIGATIEEFLGLEDLCPGESFYPDLVPEDPTA
jgi:phosphopentomutase